MRRTRSWPCWIPATTCPTCKQRGRYARGIAAASKDDFTGAEAEANAITAIRNSADFSVLQAVGIPAADVLTLAREVLDGRIAQAQGGHRAF